MLMYDNVLPSSGNYSVRNSGHDFYQLTHENVASARRPDDELTAIRKEVLNKSDRASRFLF